MLRGEGSRLERVTPRGRVGAGNRWRPRWPFRREQMSAGLTGPCRVIRHSRGVDGPRCARPSAPLWTPCSPGQGCGHSCGPGSARVTLGRMLPPSFLFCFSFLSCLCYFPSPSPSPSPAPSVLPFPSFHKFIRSTGASPASAGVWAWFAASGTSAGRVAALPQDAHTWRAGDTQ